MTRHTHSEWYADATKLKSDLQSKPDDLSLAERFWEAISGSSGYDVRDGKRAVETFRVCALKSDDGLAALLTAFKNLSEDSGEIPRAVLFDPPLENRFRMIARQAGHRLSADAAWVLTHIDAE